MKNNDQEFKGNIVDVVRKRIFKGVVVVSKGRIKEIREEETPENGYILPGLIDAHIHIESSMLVPSEFARLAVVHGTVATVSDPHEIANVLGLEGVLYMIENGKKVPFKFYFGASSCVPATGFETAGGELGLDELDDLLKSGEINYLSEMMNFPGVVYDDELVVKKIALAQKYGKPVDGHAPGLRGELLEKYIHSGISTDHECFTKEEAIEKINYGMHILIREGSAARNFEALSELIDEYPEKVMLCSDDKHPDDLVSGHINLLVKRALRSGYDKMKVLRCATFNPVEHYHLDVGLLQKEDPADFILVDNLENFDILATYINGVKVSDHGISLISPVNVLTINNFNAKPITKQDIVINDLGKRIRVITATDGQLVTGEMLTQGKVKNAQLISDTEKDILKIVVVNRYSQLPPAVGFIHGFGLKSGAIASSVAHDSHNIICVGTNDHSIVKAINTIISSQGGIVIVSSEGELLLPLRIAGIMSDEDGYKVAELYHLLDKEVKTKLKSTLKSPFMTLSFMALLVIPELKLSDKGLFNGKNFSFTDLFEN